VDRASLLNDPEAAMRIVLDGRQSTIWTALPGIVQSVDLDAMTCEVQPAIQGTVEDENGVLQSVNLPLLLDVPICFPSGGGFLITFPLAVDDEVLVVIASRCIDAWWQSGGVQRPMEARMHDLSDGFAIPGPRSQAALPEGAVSATDLEIRNDAGTTLFSITSGHKFGFENPTTSLKGILTDLETTLNTFMSTLAGFSGGGAAVTQTMLQAPASTAVTQLAAILIKIGALLK
jgi:hypothetical protein